MSKNNGEKRLILIIAGAVFILLAIFCLIVFMGRESEKDTIKIGFVMSGDIEEEGWNGMHYNGIKAACDRVDAKLIVRENIGEFTGECKTAIHELAKEGVGMIILSSYGYSEEVQELVKDYPEIVFYVNSSEYHDKNMTSYFVRMYQARYLAGIVAGMKTESNVIGYVAAMENNEVNRGINAFTLGVKSVNPEAKVVVNWTGDWDNAEKEKEAANLLIENSKADVLTYHQNQTNTVEAAEAAGIYSIGYHVALEDCSAKHLTSVVCDWELVYWQLLREYLVGKGNLKDNYWIGMEVDSVGLSLFSEAVSQDIIDEVEKAKGEILSGQDVFSGVIYDREGNQRCGEKEFISDEVLLEHMNWFVEGVEIYEG